MIEQNYAETPRGLVGNRTYVSHSIEIDSEILEPIDLAMGESPIGAPPEFHQIILDLALSGDLTKAGEHYRVDRSQSVRNLQQRFDTDSYVALGQSGSIEMLERAIRILPVTKRSKFFSLRGSFIYPDRMVRQLSDDSQGYDESYMGITSGVIDTGPDTTLEDNIYHAVERRKERSRFKQETAYYICIPNTPQGELVDPDVIEFAVAELTGMGSYVFIDEVAGDFRLDFRSAAKLTEKYEKIAVFRAFTKSYAPGWGLAYAFMSPDVANRWESKRSSEFDIRGAHAVVFNAVSDPDLARLHFDGINKNGEVVRQGAREKMMNLKRLFCDKLENSGIGYARTHLNTAYLLIDGLRTQFCIELGKQGLIVSPGSGFSATNPELTDRYARIMVPKDETQIDEVVKRVAKARNNAVQMYTAT